MNIPNIIKEDGYIFKNYTILNEVEQKIALDFRNKDSNKKWMIDQDIISIDEHKNWIKSLYNDATMLYYLVFKNNIPFMSIDYHNIDLINQESYWGYFLGNENYKSEVLKIEKIMIDIAFDRLNIEKLLCINDINNHVINIHKFFGFKEDKIVKINNREFLQMHLTRDER